MPSRGAALIPEFPSSFPALCYFPSVSSSVHACTRTHRLHMLIRICSSQCSLAWKSSCYPGCKTAKGKDPSLSLYTCTHFDCATAAQQLELRNITSFNCYRDTGFCIVGQYCGAVHLLLDLRLNKHSCWLTSRCRVVHMWLKALRSVLLLTDWTLKNEAQYI